MNNKTRYAVILKDGQEPVVENGKRVLYLSPDQVGTLYRQQPYAFRDIAEDMLAYVRKYDSDLLEDFFEADEQHEFLAAKFGKLMDPSDPIGNEEKYWERMYQVVAEYAKNVASDEYEDDDEYDEDEDEEEEYEEDENDESASEPEPPKPFALNMPLFTSYPRVDAYYGD